MASKKLPVCKDVLKASRNIAGSSWKLSLYLQMPCTENVFGIARRFEPLAELPLIIPSVHVACPKHGGGNQGGMSKTGEHDNWHAKSISNKQFDRTSTPDKGIFHF